MRAHKIPAAAQRVDEGADGLHIPLIAATTAKISGTKAAATTVAATTAKLAATTADGLHFPRAAATTAKISRTEY